jgi:hypothetical protein
VTWVLAFLLTWVVLFLSQHNRWKTFQEVSTVDKKEEEEVVLGLQE